MKLKNYLSLIIVLIFSIFNTYSQKNISQTKSNKGVLVANTNFVTRLFGIDPVTNKPANVGNVKVKGDVTLIGNNILGKVTTDPIFVAGNPIPTNLDILTAEANTPFSPSPTFGDNNDFKFEYIDIDKDLTTFSSSSADLIFKNLDGTPSICTTVAYAGLYWAASYAFTRSTDPNANNTGTPPLDDWNQIKFKIPGSANYVDITVDKNNANIDSPGQEDQVIVRDNSGVADGLTIGYPYVCYKNVTNLIKGLGIGAGGTYTVANMRAGLGDNKNGLCGGWTLVVVFENQSYPSKYITVFDGFKYIQAGSASINFDISGFKTVPPPFPVRARIGVAGLEGDQGNGDQLNFVSPIGSLPYTPLSNFNNPFNNFFNSTISYPTLTTPYSAFNLDRVPNSTNTLGFDIDIVDIPNSGNTVIANDATNATIQFPETNGDSYSSFLLTFTADIIEPNIVLTKVVKDVGGVTLPQNSPVVLGQTLTYDITYQNTGNDDAENAKITDILPNFVTFISATPDDPAVTYTKTPTVNSAGTLVFSVPNNKVLKNSPSFYSIKIVVQVTSDPNVFLNACSNIIKNTAKVSYNGKINRSLFNDDSYASFNTCGSEVTSTNFIANLVNSLILKDEKLCGSTLTLTAPTGYVSYSWTKLPSNTVIGTGPTLVITTVTDDTNGDNYNVFCDVGSPCLPKNIQYNVKLFDAGNILNPVYPFDDFPTNPITGKDDIGLQPACGSEERESLPIITLCGDVKRFINPIITNATFTWQKLNDASCPPNPFPNCHMSLLSPCTWTTVSTTSSFNVGDAGEYRVRLLFEGGCERTFYFKVYKSNLTLDAAVRNISCLVTGKITASGLGATGYEYRINNGTWQPSPVFEPLPTGPYTVEGRLAPIFPATTTLPGACVYTRNVYVQNTSNDFKVSTKVNQPLCQGDNNGSIDVQIGGANPQYTYIIKKGGNTVGGPFGPTNDVNHTFGPYGPGFYEVTGSNADGCTQTVNVEIKDPKKLIVSANLIKAVTCEDGIVKIVPQGGTGPYFYSVNGGTVLVGGVNGDEIKVPVPKPNTGLPKTISYSIVVTDFNNCEANTEFSLTTHPEPVVTTTKKDIFCYGNNSGEIKFNLVSNLGSYTISYGINGPTGFFGPSNLFTGLTAGTFKPIIKYSYLTIGNVDCFIELPAITITQPFSGLTAAGGVSELVGCGPGNTGKVRITNPQGGTPFQPGNYYLYYFNTPPPALPSPFLGVFSTTGSQTTNEAFLPAGCSTIYIQDASGCSFPMVVCLDPPPTPPTLNTPVTVYNCDASSTTTVTVNSNGGNFLYEYYLDGSTTPNPGPNPNVFPGIPCGVHNIKVDYTAIKIPTYSVLLKEDFGAGPNAPLPIGTISPNYCFHDLTLPLPHNCSRPTNENLEDTQYAVTKALIPNNSLWFPYRDHTSLGTNLNGRFLAINIGNAVGEGGILYQKQISDVIPNQPIKVDLFLGNLIRVSANPYWVPPNFRLEIVDNAGTVVAFSILGPIPRSDTWLPYSVSLDPKNNTSLKFIIRSNSILENGNDAVIDDINVYQIPKACVTSTNFPLKFDCGVAFKAQVTLSSDVTCKGATDGTITIAAQNFDKTKGFQYSTNNGLTWSAPQFTSPVTINNASNPVPGGIPAGPVKILVRYDGSSLPCTQTLTPTVGTPIVITASAIAIQATCTTGASINATASSGGTPGSVGYTFQLLNSPSLSTVPGFLLPQASPIFTNVPPGKYIVKVKDSKDCADDIDVALTIDALPKLTADISTTSSLCYDTVKQATIVATAIGGTPPFQYAISSTSFTYQPSTFSTTASFVVTPGTYTVKVRDKNLCEFETKSIVIEKQLTVSSTLIKGLDCDLFNPNAQYTINVDGGYKTYSQQVQFNANPIGAITPFVGSSFLFTASSGAGTYKITITDSKGCTAVITIVIDALVPVTATFNQVDVKCNGSNTGSFTISPSGGTPGTLGYLVQFGIEPFKPNNFTFSGLVAGAYTFIVKDSKGCTFPGFVKIKDLFDPIKAVPEGTDIKIPGGVCNGAPIPSNGTICIPKITGGLAPYSITLTDNTGGNPDVVKINVSGLAVECFNGLSFGIYSIAITDSNNCSISYPPIKISLPPNGLNIDTTVGIVTCTAGASITLNLSGPLLASSSTFYYGIYTPTNPALPPFSPFILFNPLDPTAPNLPLPVRPYYVGPFGPNHTFTGLDPKTLYTFVVYSVANQCHYLETATTGVNTISPIVVSNFVVNNVSCKGSNDAKVSFEFSNYIGATSVTYTIYNFLGNVSTGITGTSSGLTGAPVTISNLGPLAPGKYYVKIILDDGPNKLCVDATSPFTISQSPTPLTLLNVKEVKKDACTKNIGVASGEGNGGAGGYTYQIFTAADAANTAIVPLNVPLNNPAYLAFLNSATWVTNSSFGGLTGSLLSNNYVIFVKDANGCVVSQPVSVGLEPALLLDSLVVNQCDDVTSYTIKAVASGGFGTKTYTSTQATPSSNTTGIFNFSQPSVGTLVTITVKDENGCTDKKDVMIYPSLGLTALITKQPTCPNFNDGEVTVKATGGNGVYVYSIAPPAVPTATGFSGLNALIIYRITVENIATKCSVFKDVTPLQPSLPFLATIPSSQIDIKCKGDSTGSFVINLAPQTATVNNNPLYTYAIVNFPVGAVPISTGIYSNSFTGLIAGDYEVEITSNSNCKTKHIVTIKEQTKLVVPAPIVTQTGCLPNSNVSTFGDITSPKTGASAVSGGTSPYTYQFSEGTLANVVQPFGSNNSYIITNTILVPTLYFLTVQDANGCIVSSTPVTVNPFVKLESFKVLTTKPITCDPLKGLQEITVTTFINPVVPNIAPTLVYTVSRLPLPSSLIRTNNTGIFDGANGLPIGNYEITVTNTATGCVLEGPYYYVNDPNTFQANITNIVDVKCFGESNGSAQITVIDNILVPTNDAGRFKCVITKNGNPFRTDTSPDAGPFTIINLPVGNYVATCTLIDSPYCEVQPISFSIKQPSEIKINAVKTSEVTCRNTGNVGEGAIDVTVTGGNDPYLVNVTRTSPSVFDYGNFAPGNIGGLIAGDYLITVTDATSSIPKCSKTENITFLPQAVISAGILSSNLVGNKLLCKNYKDAQITVSGLVGGQQLPNTTYQYTLNNITNPLKITSNGPQQSNVFNLTGTGYGAGTYTVSVQDGYGCGIYTTPQIVITEPTDISPLLSTKRPIDCNGTGDIELTVSGGTAPYYYGDSISGSFTAFPIATPLSVIFTKPPGEYKYFIKDFNGCISVVSNTVQVQPTPFVTIKTLKATDVTCVSLTSGTITAVAQGGFNTAYTFNLSSSSTGLPIVSSNTTGEFINLVAGNYWVNVTTTGNCASVFTPINILPQRVFIVSTSFKDVTCNNKNDGELNISVTNPIGIVQFLLSPVTGLYTNLKPIQSTLNYEPITGLPPGPYTLLVYDTVNCPYTTTFTIKEPLKLNNDVTTNVVQANCAGDVTGSATINIKAGTGTSPYKVAIDGSTTFIATNNGPNSHIFSGLTGGLHTVIVLDKNGCDLTIPINLDPSIDIQPSAIVAYKCPNSANDTNVVTVSVNPELLVSGSGNVVSYSLDGGTYQSSPIFTNLSPTVHFIDVKNEISYTNPVRTRTCIKRIEKINVRFIDPLAMTLTNGNLNEIIAVTTGGTSPYNFDFNGVNTGTNSSYVFPKTDKYYVTVTDKGGCTLTVSKTFNFIDIYIPNFFSPDGDGNNDGWAPQNTYNYKNLVFYIFDRFGRKIGTFNEGEFWDGKYNGQELPSGDYWYLVKPEGASDAKEYVGNFSLYR